MDRHCNVYRLGIMSYAEAWQLQARLAEAIAAGRQPPTLLLLEHPHTFTFGRRGQAENLLWDAAELERRGVSVHWVDRGGDITYHGPGQLVGYPLIPLTPLTQQSQTGCLSQADRLPKADYVGYLRRLETVLIAALARLGVTAIRLEGLTGVWIERAFGSALSAPAKIAAIGVKVDSRGITRHGFALNVAPVMEYWSGIVGCGLAGYTATSLAEHLAPPLAMDQVSDALVAAFGEVFTYKMLEPGASPLV